MFVTSVFVCLLHVFVTSVIVTSVFVISVIVTSVFGTVELVTSVFVTFVCVFVTSVLVKSVFFTSVLVKSAYVTSLFVTSLFLAAISVLLHPNERSSIRYLIALTFIATSICKLRTKYLDRARIKYDSFLCLTSSYQVSIWYVIALICVLTTS